MKKKYYLIILSIILIIGCADNVKVPDSVELNTWEDSVSYSIGSDVGKSFSGRDLEFHISDFNKGFTQTYSKDSSYAFGASLASNLILQGIKVNPLVLLNAFECTNNGDSLQLPNSDIEEILGRYRAQLQEESAKRAQAEAENNEKEGRSFIEEYKSKYDDEIVTESGLVYRIISEGYGEKPKADDRIIAHYTGKLIDGTVFDSSIERGEPITFSVNGVIKGWQEALQLMMVGSKWEIVIPSELGYGDRPKPGGKIPANSTLIFEVELLGIE